MTEREQVIAEARSWLRTPFHHRQRVKGLGVDCAGLIAAVYEATGAIPAVELPEYTRDWFLHCKREDSTLYADLLDEHMKRVEEPKPGDVVAMKYGVCVVAHAGILIDGNYFIAASALERCVCLVERRQMSEIITGYWSPRKWHKSRF